MRYNFGAVLKLLFFISVVIPLQANGVETPGILKYVTLEGGRVFGITEAMGFLYSADNGITWSQRNSGLPLKTVYPFNGNEYKRLTSIYVDPLDPVRIAVTESSGLYLSSNGGLNWEQIETGGPVKQTNYFTSVSLDPGNKSHIILGSSFNGIFETFDRGVNWKKISIDQSSLYRGAGFYEEISALGMDPYNKDRIYVAAGFSGGVFVGDYQDNKLKPLIPPGTAAFGTVDGFDIRKAGLGVYSDNIFYFKGTDMNLWNRVIPMFAATSNRVRNEDSTRISNPADRTGIYVNSFHADGDALDTHIAFMKKHNLNSMVVDMKDDEGKITYGTSLELPKKLGAVRNRFDIAALINKAKENNIYLIGRIVVFKDPMLYRYLDSSYAIWDFKKKAPWGNLLKRTDSETGEETWAQYEHWVDPYSDFVWRYNIAIAEELQTLGVDEIQFDYIRFPSDGDLSTAQYRSKKPGMTRIDALESFMRAAREKIFISISTDLYGFNSWYRMGNWIGQNIEMLANYVDVISPMYYPSHFPASFIDDMEYLERAKFIYAEGTRRAMSITENKSLIRPYVQAFLIGKELDMEYDEYTRYLELQLEGIKESGGSGYTMWNNSNRYYMVAD